MVYVYDIREPGMRFYLDSSLEVQFGGVHLVMNAGCSCDHSQKQVGSHRGSDMVGRTEGGDYFLEMTTWAGQEG